VGVFEGGADLARDQERVIDRERKGLLAAAGEHGHQALALEELVGDPARAPHLAADPEDPDDVRVLELGGELHLVHEQLHALGVRGQGGGEAEDGDDLLQPGGTELGRAVLRPQPGGVDLLQEDELAELLLLDHGRRVREK
jgi:hypothetical protein